MILIGGINAEEKKTVIAKGNDVAICHIIPLITSVSVLICLQWTTSSR